MHIYLMTRGIKHDVDRFINELSAKYLPFKVNSASKQHNMDPKTNRVQVGVRPIQLWEVVIPRESRELVCRTLFYGKHMENTQHSKHQKYIWALRKMLGVQAIPRWDTTGDKMPLYDNNVEKIGIGIKEDYNFTDGTEGL